METDQLQEDFFSYLYVMASFNEAAGTNLSYDDFISTEDKSLYENAFASANQKSEDMNLTPEGLEKVSKELDNAVAPKPMYMNLNMYMA